jgi:serine/threonine-protein kinase SRPK3
MFNLVEASSHPALHELEFLQRIRDHAPHDPGFQHVTQLVDDFTYSPSSAAHQCLVFDPLSQNLESCRDRFERRRLLMSLVKQVHQETSF